MAERYPPEVITRWNRFGTFMQRAKRDRQYPCAICGWDRHMAIHQPIIVGPRKGETAGHAYEPYGVTVVDPLSDTQAELDACTREIDVIYERWPKKEDRQKREALLTPIRARCVEIGQRRYRIACGVMVDAPADRYRTSPDVLTRTLIAPDAAAPMVPSPSVTLRMGADGRLHSADEPGVEDASPARPMQGLADYLRATASTMTEGVNRQVILQWAREVESTRGVEVKTK